jgi:hypothetical protein
MLNLGPDFSKYEIILQPDQIEPGWWAGAPSVTVDADGVFHLAARMRYTLSPPGIRGYEIRILRSEDGIHFTPVHSITREAAGVRGFERPALVQNPETGRWRLYCCTDLEGLGWTIIVFDEADSPEQIDPATARNALEPPAPHGILITPGYKDPFVFLHEGQWHLLAIGIDHVERLWHFTSPDGYAWTPSPNAPLFDNGGWHNLYTRPACVLRQDPGWLLVYEGCNAAWHDPNYNIATGLAYTANFERVTDLTPDAPLVESSTPGAYRTWRYSHWLRYNGQLWVYAECARADDTNEIRLFRGPLPG